MWRANLSTKNTLNPRLKSLAEVESRTQPSRPRPKTRKNSEAKAKDQHFDDRPSRGQGQEWLRPRPRTEDKSFLNYGRQIFQISISGRLNLDGGTLNLDGGTLNLDVLKLKPYRPPYNLSTGYTTCNVQR